MATLAEFNVPADAFPLEPLFAEFPDVVVELERVVPTGQVIAPYFWVKGADSEVKEKIAAVLQRDPEIIDFKLVDEIDSGYLIRIEWSDKSKRVTRAIAETDVIIVSGTGTADEWTFEVRADDRDDIAAFQHRCREHGIPLELTALHALSTHEGGGEYDLTDAQREALVLAYERGYFDSPRRATLAEIAAELDITRQSLASRLRRGHKRLLRSTLVDA